MAIRRDAAPKRLLVLGASGRTGRLVVEQALGHGHEVVGLVRPGDALARAHARVREVAGDVTDPATVAAAIVGCDAVISTLGPGSERPVHVYSDGIANTIRAMSARGVERLVVVSAQGVGVLPQERPLKVRAARAVPGTRAVYDDLERMEGDVMLSDLDWTIVRPARVTEGEQTGHYRAVAGQSVPGGSRISRADLAGLLLKCAEGELYSRRAMAVAY